MCNGVEAAEVMLDFETATWTALRETFDNITIKGCLFHYTQAIMRWAR